MNTRIPSLPLGRAATGRRTMIRLLKRFQNIAIDFSSLVILQGMNYLVPLVTAPLLMTRLGPSGFGELAFAQAFAMFFGTLADYGHGLTATREVALNRHEPRRLSKIIRTTLGVRLITLSVSLALMTALVMGIPSFREHRHIYMLASLQVLGTGILPVWFFEGMRLVRYVNCIQGISRIAMMFAMLYFVKTDKDIATAGLLQWGSTLCGALASLGLMFMLTRVMGAMPDPRAVLAGLRQGFELFLSTISTSVFITANTFILGLLCDDRVVGYYSFAEKIALAVIQLCTLPMSKVVYPRICEAAARSREQAVALIRNLLWVVASASFVGSLVLYMAASPIIKCISRGSADGSIQVFSILAWWPCVFTLNNLLGTQALCASVTRGVLPRLSF